jgi:hypothetical protein
MDVVEKQTLKRGDVKTLRAAIREGFRLRILKDGTWASMVRPVDGFGFPVEAEAARQIVALGLRGDWLREIVTPGPGLDLDRADWYEFLPPASGAKRGVFGRFWDWLKALLG